MSSALLARVASPADLKKLSETDLERLAAEMRQELIRVHHSSSLAGSGLSWTR